MKRLMFMALCSLFLSVTASAKQIVVAVLDTGINVRRFSGKLCASGHASFVKDPWNVDISGHGTNVASLIARYAGDADYCILVIKIFNNSDATTFTTQIGKALEAASKANVVNLSYAGSHPIPEEQSGINDLIVKGVTVFAGAGNDGQDLSERCTKFPACYNRLIFLVQSGESLSNLHSFSNRYLKNDRRVVTEDGNHQCAGFICLQGTSQATAIATGKFVNALARSKK